MRINLTGLENNPQTAYGSSAGVAADLGLGLRIQQGEGTRADDLVVDHVPPANVHLVVGPVRYDGAKIQGPENFPNGITFISPFPHSRRHRRRRT